jgi:phosphoribosylanthranilate isomerase
MTLVKICGISEAKHARAAAALGADFVGMIFAPSKRQVTIGQAKRIASALRKERGRLRAGASTAELEEAIDHGRPLLVGVFADQDADTINGIAEECGLDIVQLAGSEPWEMCSMIERPVFKCMKVKPGDEASGVIGSAGDGGILLLDPYVAGTYGGTGQTLDWDVAAVVAKQRPTVLAGGLTPENVGGAIRIVRPWAVDVSSGIESDGTKDVDKIRSFIAAAKEAQGASDI